MCRPFFRLCRRFLQDPDGRYYIGSAAQGAEIPYKNTERLEVCLCDLPSHYSEKKVSDVQPSNCLLPDFIPQLQPHLMLAGKEAFFKVQLTQVQDGCVLGFSVSHGLTGKQSLFVGMKASGAICKRLQCCTLTQPLAPWNTIRVSWPCWN